jgi:outer membrane protein
MVLNFSLPLYEGGAISNAIEKNEVELINLKLKYNEIKNLIEKNINQNLNSLLKSYEKIDYSQIAQKYAKKNYELVLDRYKSGSETIISLLDAQNSYMVSKLNESISSIDYLIDLISVYFFSGNIEVLVNEDKKSKFEKELLGVLDEK